MSKVKEPNRIISEQEFRQRLIDSVESDRQFFQQFKSVTGPGRSGAVAAVYFSHYLGIPFLPYKSLPPANLCPILIADTAIMTGKTVRKASKFYQRNGATNETFSLYNEPPIVRFFYEDRTFT